ncbi:MAG: hypothetical protein GEU78_16665 [Actinobacteria bacterium]|nr:hypothetical protein [Actinomycetota bacterium]
MLARDFSGITQAGEKPVRTEVAYDALDRVQKVRHRKQADDAETADFTFTRFAYDLNSNVETRVEDGAETPDGSPVTAVSAYGETCRTAYS